jgi:hypothetical protein
MNGARAKVCRKIVYEGANFRDRTYIATPTGYWTIAVGLSFLDRNGEEKQRLIRIPKHTVTADPLRQGYQHLKRAVRNGGQ